MRSPQKLHANVWVSVKCSIRVVIIVKQVFYSNEDILCFSQYHKAEVVTLSHTLLESPQGVPKVPNESLRSSPSITLVFPDSKDSPRTPCIILIKRGLFQESLYNPTGTDQGLCHYI